MIRLLCCVVCWTLFAIPAAVFGFASLYVTGSVDLLWRLSVWAGVAGYRLCGIRVRAVRQQDVEDGRAYLFMSNHASNLDPPVITPLLGQRISIIAKQELFKIPFFGRAMRAAGFVAVNRSNSGPRSIAFVTPLQCCNQGGECWCFPRVPGRRMAGCCHSRRVHSCWRWKPVFRWCQSQSAAATKPGRREKCRFIQGRWWCTSTPPSIRTASRARKICWLPFALPFTAHFRSRTATPLRPNLPLADAHSIPYLEGNLGGTLRAEIELPRVLPSHLIFKFDTELAWRSDGRHVPVGLLIRPVAAGRRFRWDGRPQDSPWDVRSG